MRVLILEADDWEGLYIDGKLIDDADTLGEGDSRLYLLKMSEEHGFTSSDVEEKYVTDEDEDYLFDHGGFPKNLSELKGKY